MTKEEFVARCVFHEKNYYKNDYYKTEAWLKNIMLTGSEEHLFRCPRCGKLVTFSELEFWAGDDTAEDVMNEQIPCSYCYEDEMGEDL